MKQIVHVTQQDLDKGVYTSNCKCPIALALKRVFPTESITVGASNFDVGGQKYKFNQISPRLQDESNRIALNQARPFWFRFEVRRETK